MKEEMWGVASITRFSFRLLYVSRESISLLIHRHFDSFLLYYNPLAFVYCYFYSSILFDYCGYGNFDLILSIRNNNKYIVCCYEINGNINVH